MSVTQTQTPSLRRVVLADWDNTLYAGFTQKRWVEFLASHGLFKDISAMEDRLSEFITGSLKYEEFCSAMADAYARGLSGRSTSEIAAAARLFLETDAGIFPFVRGLWQLFEAEALKVIVISGAPAEILHQYATTIGFEVGGALQLEIKQHRYTGEVLENAGLKAIKLAAVGRVLLNSIVSVGMGDAASDLPLVEVASVACIVLGPHNPPDLFGPDTVPLDPTQDPLACVQQLRRALTGRSAV